MLNSSTLLVAERVQRIESEKTQEAPKEPVNAEITLQATSSKKKGGNRGEAAALSGQGRYREDGS